MANLRNLFTRYRWIICYVLLISVCLTFRHIIIWYKSRPPNRIHVYDLTWLDETDPNNVIYRRWRYFLKPRSYLPFKVEKYSRGDPDNSYALEETLVISCPGTDEIREVLEGAAGPCRN